MCVAMEGDEVPNYSDFYTLGLQTTQRGFHVYTLGPKVGIRCHHTWSLTWTPQVIRKMMAQILESKSPRGHCVSDSWERPPERVPVPNSQGLWSQQPSRPWSRDPTSGVLVGTVNKSALPEPFVQDRPNKEIADLVWVASEGAASHPISQKTWVAWTKIY